MVIIFNSQRAAEMFKLVTFSVLLGAALMLSGYVEAALENNIEPVDDIDPVTELDNHVLELIESSAPEERLGYKEACRKLAMSTELGQELRPQVKELAELMSQLVPPNLPLSYCTGTNLRNLRVIMDLVVGYKEKLHNEGIGRYLRSYAHQGQVYCLVTGDMDLLSEPRLESLQDVPADEYRLLEQLDAICVSKDRAKSGIEYSVALLSCASKLPEQVGTVESKLKGVLQDMYETRHSEVEQLDKEDLEPYRISPDKELSESKSIKLEDARDFLERNLLERCQSFLGKIKIGEYLDIATDVGLALSKTGEKPYSQWKFVFEFASRAAICKWFLDRDIEELAEILSSN